MRTARVAAPDSQSSTHGGKHVVNRGPRVRCSEAPYQVSRLPHRCRAAEQITLHQSALQVTEQSQLLLGFHALADDFESKSAGHGEYRLDQSTRLPIGIQCAHETL